ncbi:helix-turn-helix domain-containing protein [Phycicoccus endophyticus]|uniref:Helix-turn-helix domain-containing protein n=1 Tax=Phycicoccus endophyticus TaxID=1690220 RepID=A0A7G9R3F2_9MICO|nr:helix-turn-helix domain-containing protein [Phycicoccus endophyticus]NHI19883.1 helix-turn-helix domain-containing protein [Phycicoccus endophyticus]QNN50127.1 helix-turn-helix domain-containing protein [Phycicoccus endophyticus]GGL27790.1 hypothetical protein GCM10012283_07510 [Phycicoccus endophyticus]
MAQQYVIDIETTERDPELADEWIDQLAAWHGVVSAGPTGALVVTLSLPAEGLAQATATGLAIVAGLATPVAITAQPESMRDERQGWPRVPELMSVAEAAEALGVSRQRVLQMIDEGKVPAVRVGKVHAIPASAFAGRRALEQMA